ncbi:MAG TPA: alcohol dehydrogenase catalytic domain-containing protein [Thermoanaerobaculia bacterium]|nr:alcohol dehydrogenase catalytic domain-containing protein [Thermoanaerobaculia bacterium]
MKAIQLIANERALELREIDTPTVGAEEIRVDIRAAGICHSDAHYRRGGPRLGAFPLTLGHEVAGIVAERGANVRDVSVGDRVALHYLVTCGSCAPCAKHGEQFCAAGEMIGKDRHGGYAESIVIPARNAIRVPDAIPLEHAAVMMCSTATAFHALRLASFARGESLAILGFGGLGMSALLLAQKLGAANVFVIERNEAKRAAAKNLGATVVDDLRDVDVALDFIGNPELCTRALRGLAPGGRLMLVALSTIGFDFNPYRDLLGRETRIIGCSDHLRSELEELMSLGLDLGHAVTRTVPFDASAINVVLDELDAGTTPHFRTVITR